jgi:hypothetical protein
MSVLARTSLTITAPKIDISVTFEVDEDWPVADVTYDGDHWASATIKTREEVVVTISGQESRCQIAVLLRFVVPSIASCGTLRQRQSSRTGDPHMTSPDVRFQRFEFVIGRDTPATRKARFHSPHESIRGTWLSTCCTTMGSSETVRPRL